MRFQDRGGERRYTGRPIRAWIGAGWTGPVAEQRVIHVNRADVWASPDGVHGDQRFIELRRAIEYGRGFVARLIIDRGRRKKRVSSVSKALSHLDLRVDV